MKKSRRFIIGVFVIGALSATGCIQPVEIAPPVEKQIFVKCILDSGTEIQRATLYYSGGTGQDSFEPVTDAEVTVSGVPFQSVGDGVYEGLMKLGSDMIYQLKVFVPGFDTLEATTRVPEFFYVGSDFNPPEQWLEDDAYNEVDLNPWSLMISNTASRRMHARGGRSLSSVMPGMVYWVSSTGGPHHLYVLGRMEDSTGVIAPISQLATNSQLVDNVNANGKTYRAQGDASLMNNDRKLKYERDIASHYEGLALHDGYLRIDIPDNYDNGLRNVYNLLYPALSGINPDDNPHWDPSLDVSRYFSVVGDFNYNIWGKYDWKLPHPVLYFCSVSEEYDRYLRSVQASLAEKKGDLLTTLYQENAEYSNIRGGHGVFGAVITLRHDCDLYHVPGWVEGTFYYDWYGAYGGQLPEI